MTRDTGSSLVEGYTRLETCVYKGNSSIPEEWLAGDSCCCHLLLCLPAANDAEAGPAVLEELDTESQSGLRQGHSRRTMPGSLTLPEGRCSGVMLVHWEGVY